MSKSALITGITGQDGSYLAELLLSKGYGVYGLVRRASTPNTWRIDHLLDKITLIPGDMTDSGSLFNALEIAHPNEVYNLAAQSFVAVSHDIAAYTTDVNMTGAARLLDAIIYYNPTIRFYQASSSEMFGNSDRPPHNEQTPFRPRSPYGASKAGAHYLTVNYREAYGLFACCGILFNHESPRRGMEFVTRKIAHNVAKIRLGLADSFNLGNLNARRDWGFAGDYVEAMWLMLQQDRPDDYVIATGISHSVSEFLGAAFGTDYWGQYVNQDEKLMRRSEVNYLLGDASKAHIALQWEPTISFEELVTMMVDAEMERLDGQANKAKGRKQSQNHHYTLDS